MRRDVEIAERGHEAGAGATFGELAAAMLRDAEREGLAAKTLRGYDAALRRHLLPRFAGRAIGDLGGEEIAALIASLRARGLTENAVVDVLKPLRRTLALAEREGLIESNPYRELDRDGRPVTVRDEHRILSAGEIEALAGAADRHTGVAIGLALFCGVRSAEARALRAGDLDRDEPALWVPRQGPARRDRRMARARPARRRVDALGDAFGFLAALADRIAEREPGPRDFLVPSPTGGRFDRGNFSRRYREVVKRAGLDAPGARLLTFAQLRHNFAAIAARIGTDPIALLRQLGNTHLISLQGHLPYFEQPPLEPGVRKRLAAAARRLCR